MHIFVRRFGKRSMLAMLLACGGAMAASLSARLTLDDEGSFFVNGQSMRSEYPGASLATGPAAAGNITVNHPFVTVWGDNSVGAAGVNGDKRRNGCVQAVTMIKGGGGRAAVLLLPDAGIPGNSHMLMMDRNNLQIAELLRKWIVDNVR